MPDSETVSQLVFLSFRPQGEILKLSYCNILRFLAFARNDRFCNYDTASRSGIQSNFSWIPSFDGMTEIDLFNCRSNNKLQILRFRRYTSTVTVSWTVTSSPFDSHGVFGQHDQPVRLDHGFLHSQAPITLPRAFKIWTFSRPRDCTSPRIWLNASSTRIIDARFSCWFWTAPILLAKCYIKCKSLSTALPEQNSIALGKYKQEIKPEPATKTHDWTQEKTPGGWNQVLIWLFTSISPASPSVIFYPKGLFWHFSTLRQI